MQEAHPLRDEGGRSDWFVRNNYRLRSVAFCLMFVGLGMELWLRGAAPLTWLLLALQLLVYPHVLYWRAMRARDPHGAEMRHLTLDSFLIGIWIAALAFPLWPSFTFWLACSLNSTVIRGWRGFRASTLAFAGGIGLSIAAFGFRFQPDTAWPTTLLMILGFTFYPLVIGNAAFLRSKRLRATREKLREGEQTLHAANQTLQEKLAEIVTLQAKLKEQAIRDPLTGLFNRRYLDTVAPIELARSDRERHPVCLMMIDIDHFKRINDTYGHQAGDEVLKALAGMLNDSVRTTDIACRFGGEEFLLLLPHMTTEVALQRAEHWRAAFEALRVSTDGAVIKATLSIGVSCYPVDGSTLEALTRCADVALYRAKAEGRNRVVLCQANAKDASTTAHSASTPV